MASSNCSTMKEQLQAKNAASVIALQSKSAIHHRLNSIDAAKAAPKSADGFAFVGKTQKQAFHPFLDRIEKR